MAKLAREKWLHKERLVLNEYRKDMNFTKYKKLAQPKMGSRETSYFMALYDSTYCKIKIECNEIFHKENFKI